MRRPLCMKKSHNQNIEPEEIKTTINGHNHIKRQFTELSLNSHISKIDDYNSEIDQQDSIKVCVGNSTENIYHRF